MSENHKKGHSRKAAPEKAHEVPVVEEMTVEEAVEDRAERTHVPAMRPAWEVFTQAFNTWKANWKLFTGIEVLWAAGSIAVIIVAAVAAGFLTASSGIFSGDRAGSEVTAALLSNSGALSALIVCGVLALVALVIGSTWLSVTTVVAWDNVRRGEDMGVRATYARAWRFVPRYIWISIIAMALVALGIFGLLIPGVMLAVAFSLLPVVAVKEGLTGRHAVMRTTQLARPYLPRLFWRILLTTVVIYVPGWIVSAILNAMLGKGVGDTVDQLYGLVMAPVFTGVLFATYEEFRSVERRQKFLVRLSLERLALIGAIASALIITAFLVFGR